ncbi:hypothetical protein OG455_19210 [Kitasatospora sp. NBC_01287]|uniref:WXG100-like domain-containing protein n=1 Tax=Kitasatospora sp. NBC_01287 TaxID=2903573 RepID=UPI0022543685|nr:hypothetical protein [Kitasatospora sp. NBC_01287]MCX4747620.1 hypothetical protein [Kitasatospora sp. NBC_01287]
MGLTQDAEKTVRDLTGMWWPDADEDGLRRAAKAWSDCADAIDDVCSKANTTAQGIVHDNSGPAVDAFGKFWAQYYDSGKGWLHDTSDACRQIAKAFTQYADEVGKAKHQLEEKIALVGGVLIAGTALAFFTGGLSEAAADGAAAGIVSAAAAVGVTVSETVATIAGTVLTGAVFGAAESATVDLAVAQPIKIAFGDQKGISGTEILDAAETGGIAGGAASGFGAGAKILAESSDTLAPALNALSTMPGRMLVGGGMAAGQDAVFNGGSIDPLDLAAGIIGGAAAPGGRGNDDPAPDQMGTRRQRAAQNDDKSDFPVPPRIPGDGALPTGDPVYYRPGSTAVGYDSSTVSNFDNVAPKPGYHDVVIHGNNQGYFEPGRINAAGKGFSGGDTHPGHIADAIRNSPYYEGGPIRLVSCHSGTVGDGIAEVPAAQTLANELGVPVMAPTNKVGTVPALGAGQEPQIFGEGYWRTFLPMTQ